MYEYVLISPEWHKWVVCPHFRLCDPADGTVAYLFCFLFRLRLFEERLGLGHGDHRGKTGRRTPCVNLRKASRGGHSGGYEHRSAGREA